MRSSYLASSEMGGGMPKACRRGFIQIKKRLPSRGRTDAIRGTTPVGMPKGTPSLAFNAGIRPTRRRRLLGGLRCFPAAGLAPSPARSGRRFAALVPRHRLFISGNIIRNQSRKVKSFPLDFPDKRFSGLSLIYFFTLSYSSSLRIIRS